MNEPVRVACVQAEPVVLDRAATLEKLEQLTEEVAAAGARLALFPEAFIRSIRRTGGRGTSPGGGTPPMRAACTHGSRGSL